MDGRLIESGGAMRWLLTASFMVGLVVAPLLAQRSASAGHTGGFSAPHMSGGFSSGTHFSSPPTMPRTNFSSPPQYHWNMPGRYSGNQPSYPVNGSRYSPPASDRYHSRPPYPVSYYRQPYVPYFYARSTYLVPGLLNSYWDYPSSSYSDDQSASYPAQGQLENNGDYEPEPAPYEPQQTPDVPPPPPGPSESLPQGAVTIVFKDGHSQQIHNYALTKTTLYILDDAASGRRPEIPLDRIDVSATERTNREAGVDFDVPTGAN
jgi:hypothetical protein